MLRDGKNADNEVKDLFETMPENKSLDFLETIIKQTGKPNKGMFGDLFRNVQLGDGTASQLLRHME